MKTLALIACLALAAFAGWKHFTSANAATSGSAPASGNPIEIVGPDLYDAHQVSLSGFAPGRVVVVNIWASYCSACNVEAPGLKAFAAAHPGALFSLDTNEPASAGQAALASWGFRPQAVVSDPTRQLGFSPGIHCTGLPCTLFLNAQHRLTTMIVGALQPDEWARNYQAAGGS